MLKSCLSVCLSYTVSCQREMVKELATWDVEFKKKASAEVLANLVGQSQTVLLPVPTPLGEGSQSCLSWLGGLGEGHLIWIGGEIWKDERPLKEGS